MKSINFGLGQLISEKQVNEKQVKQGAPVLGERELEVMKILWRDGALSAQDVLRASSEPQPSLSTMQSTLERLHRKALVSRHKTGRYYLYSATVSRSAIISQLLGDIAEHFSEGDVAPMISGFISYMDRESDTEDNETLPKSMLKTMQAFSDKNND